MRYKVNNQQMNEFDERRLIDSRFWLFMGAITNSLYQI